MIFVFKNDIVICRFFKWEGVIMENKQDVRVIKLIQRVSINMREPQMVMSRLSEMKKVSFDVSFRNLFLESGIIPSGGEMSVSFYDTGKYRIDKEIKNLFEINSSHEFDPSVFVSVLFSLLNHQVSNVGLLGYLPNGGRAVCFFVSSIDKQKVYTVTISFIKFPLLEWRVRVFEENEYRWRTSDWLVVPG